MVAVQSSDEIDPDIREYLEEILKDGGTVDLDKCPSGDCASHLSRLSVVEITD